MSASETSRSSSAAPPVVAALLRCAKRRGTTRPPRRSSDVEPTPGVAKPDPILVADDVTRTFGGIRAVSVDHLEVQRGAITALIGPNGAGKTTFFNLLTGFDKPDTGAVMFDGQTASGEASYTLASKGMVRTFQLTKVLAKMSVLDNMMLAAQEQTGESMFRGLVRKWTGQERDVRAQRPRGARALQHGAHAGRVRRARCPVVSASCSRWRGR